MTDNIIYKFYPPHWGRDALYRARFKVTTLADINDPFEFLATSRQKKLRIAARDLKEERFSTSGVISFSKSWQEPLLWSHYAANHTGVALGFKLIDPLTGFTVTYSDDRVQFPDPSTSDLWQRNDFWHNIRVRKYKGWEYENEVRLFPSLDITIAENALHFLPFEHVAKLNSVILGPSYEPINDAGLQESLEKVGVKVITTRLGFRTFNVEQQRYKKLTKVI